VRDFEVAPYANEHRAGFGWLWRDGAAFGEWFVGVTQRMKEIFPEARFGYPGLAAGGDVIGRQQDAVTFLSQSSAAAREADWIGVVCQIGSPSDVLEMAARDFPDKRIIVTEVLDPETTDAETRAIRQIAFLRDLNVDGVDSVLFDLSALGTAADTSVAWEAGEILAQAVRDSS